MIGAQIHSHPTTASAYSLARPLVQANSSSARLVVPSLGADQTGNSSNATAVAAVERDDDGAHKNAHALQGRTRARRTARQSFSCSANTRAARERAPSKDMRRGDEETEMLGAVVALDGVVDC